MRFKKILLLICIFLAQFPRATAAQAMVSAQFGPDTTKIELFPYIEIFADSERTLTFNDILNGAPPVNFKPAIDIGNSFGFSKDFYWVHFSLHADADLQKSILLQLDTPLIDKVILFVPDGQGGFKETVTGDSTLFQSRDIKHRTFLFRLPEHRGKTFDYYLCLQTEGSMQIPLTLWSADTFIEHVDRSNFILGSYYGIMLLLMLAAIVSYLMVRDKLFLFYTLYLFSYLLFQLSLNGFSYQYLWPGLPWFTSRATSAFIGFVVICGSLFASNFLQVWGNKHPRVKLLFALLITSGLIGMIMSFLGDYALAVQISTISGVLFPPVVLIAIVSSLAKGYRPAKYFLIAWCIFLLGVFIGGLLYLGFVPQTFLTSYAMQVGSIFEITLLGYALMDRINILRIDKEKAIIQANDYLHQLNEELEQLVNERTRKLQEKNKKLRELAIQDSMTGLLNHNASRDYLKRMEKSAQRYGNDLAVIMMDIDEFKLINDKFGHPAGDKVILAIADILTATIRESDGCGRYGGEEFLLILPESSSKEACIIAERIRENIMKLKIPSIHNTSVSASFGIAMFDPFHPDADLIALADNSLYQAKGRGRNQFVCANFQKFQPSKKTSTDD